MRYLLPAAIFLTLCASAAHAGSAEVNMRAVLKNLNGDAMQDCNRAKASDPRDCAEFVPLTLGRFASAALNLIEPNMKPEDMTLRGHLAREIRNAEATGDGTISLDPRDIDLIRTQMAKTGTPPSVVEEAYELLMPPAKK